MNKKAQEARNDLLLWYVITFIAVVSSVSLLYGLGFIGGFSFTETDSPTGAVVVENFDEVLQNDSEILEAENFDEENS